MLWKFVDCGNWRANHGGRWCRIYRRLANRFRRFTDPNGRGISTRCLGTYVVDLIISSRSWLRRGIQHCAGNLRLIVGCDTLPSRAILNSKQKIKPEDERSFVVAKLLFLALQSLDRTWKGFCGPDMWFSPALKVPKLSCCDDLVLGTYLSRSTVSEIGVCTKSTGNRGIQTLKRCGSL